MMKKIFTLSLSFIFCLCLSNTKAQTWVAMGSGLGSSTETVKAIAENPLTHEVYAGGTFSGGTGFLAKWNGTSWDILGTGINGPVLALAFKSNATTADLYVGGLFTNAGGVSVNNVAKWSGTSWSDVGGGFNDQVNCIYISSSTGKIYAGGKFTLSGSNTMNHISELVSGTWTQIGSGIGSVVNAISNFSLGLYAGCELASGPVQVYDGSSSWSAVSGISGGKVYALASIFGYLYAGGDFSQPTFAAAKFNGSSWSTIQTIFGSSDKIYALSARYSTLLYIGGKFTNLGVSSAASYIAKITSATNPIQTFTLTSSNLNGEVYAIGNQSGKVLAGGKFTSPGTNIAITSTTINVNEINDITVEKNFFPNPVHGKAHLSVKASERLGNPGIKIFDLQSREIENLPVEIATNNNEIEFIIDCSSLSAGNYYYLLTDEGKGITSDKFIIE